MDEDIPLPVDLPAGELKWAQSRVSRLQAVMTAIAAVVKSHGGERCGNAGTMIPAGTVERGERKREQGLTSRANRE